MECLLCLLFCLVEKGTHNSQDYGVYNLKEDMDHKHKQIFGILANFGWVWNGG
jgi:hypothetical protein